MVFENYYVSRQNQQHTRMATSYKIYMKQLTVPKQKEKQLILLQFTRESC